MSKVYFVRHQAAGFVTEYPFAEEPTEEQIAAVAKKCFQSFGGEHPKSKEEYWVKVFSFDVLGASDVPVVPDRSLSSVVNAAAAGEFLAAGTGTVTPKAGV